MVQGSGLTPPPSPPKGYPPPPCGVGWCASPPPLWCGLLGLDGHSDYVMEAELKT